MSTTTSQVTSRLRAISDELALSPKFNPIDYDSVLEMLIGDPERKKGIEEFATISGHLSREQFLREHRTIGWTNSRQTGKSTWAVDQYVSKPGDVSIVDVNKAMMVSTMTSSKSTEMGKFFTAMDIIATVGEHKGVVPRLSKTKFVIVQDSMFVLDRVGYRTLYKWLAMSEVEDMWIILV